MVKAGAPTMRAVRSSVAREPALHLAAVERREGAARFN
jgi:hypothetical protein